MTVLQFISATIGQLVWPVLVLLVVLVLREPIKNLAASPRLKTLKAGPGGIEVEFREELGDVQKELTDSSTSEGEEPVYVDKSGLDDFRAEMTRLAEVSPRSVVMESHARLERFLREGVKRNAGATQPRVTGMRSLIRTAHEQGWLSPSRATAMQELAYLRNRVAHEPDEVITTDTALWYANVVAELAAELENVSGWTTADGPYL